MVARAAIVVLVLAGATRAAEPVPLGACGPIARRYASVEIPAGRLGRLNAPPLAQVGVVAFGLDGASHPIPFQIDERRGRKLALPDGPEPTADDKPGVLDAEDMIVFMACDAGRARAAADVDKALGPVTTWREIRVDDPLDHTTGFAYLVIAPDPPKTDRRYVAYDASVDMVRTATYRVGLVDALPVYLALSANGSPGPNLIDGLRLRADATLRGNLAHWTLNERQGHHELIAWKVGPVRVVRRSRHRVSIGFGIELTAGTAHTFFYPQHVFAPGSLKLPFSPSVFFRDIHALGGADGRDLVGWRYLAAGVRPPGFAVDGKTDADEKAFAGTGDWFALAHDSESLLFVLRMSDNLKHALQLRLAYRDDAKTPAPPEFVPGTMPLVGYEANGVEKLQGGRYDFDLSIFAIPSARPEDAAHVRAQLGTSLTADLGAQGPASSAAQP